MKALLGAVSVIALMTATANAQSVTLTPGGAGAQADFIGNFVDAFSPDSVESNPVPPGDGTDTTISSDTGPNSVYAGDGLGNILTVNSAGNEAANIQQGNDNQGFIVQDAATATANNQAALIQNGDDNTGLIVQEDQWNEASVVQVGTNNISVTLQSENNGVISDQLSSTFQIGNDHVGVVDQTGDGNAAGLLQYNEGGAAAGNTAAILQTSDSSDDASSRNSAAVIQWGEGNESFISQNDSRTDISGPFGTGYIDPASGILPGLILDPDMLTSVGGGIDVNGTNAAAVVQLGNANSNAIVQHGSGNISGIVQISTP